MVRVSYGVYRNRFFATWKKHQVSQNDTPRSDYLKGTVYDLMLFRVYRVSMSVVRVAIKTGGEILHRFVAQITSDMPLL